MAGRRLKLDQLLGEQLRQTGELGTRRNPLMVAQSWRPELMVDKSKGSKDERESHNRSKCKQDEIWSRR